ncbi:unnamed protein product [Dibothriocephalus latus]|uniref:Uncharacterized protein n=1 Tax=Dibothriocephalus latus TaxID=60516 RepID=A0A3P7LHD9_DIBLA|nr:unnamed protein product [Dibothriocephalus latus]
MSKSTSEAKGDGTGFVGRVEVDGTVPVERLHLTLSSSKRCRRSLISEIEAFCKTRSFDMLTHDEVILVQLVLTTSRADVAITFSIRRETYFKLA